jgi:hypothetical protein
MDDVLHTRRRHQPALCRKTTRRRTSQYMHCVGMYADAAIHLTREPRVGIGSICRRQATIRIGFRLNDLHRAGVSRLHGFGMKLDGLESYGDRLASSDSMSWSFSARMQYEPRPYQHRGCAVDKSGSPLAAPPANTSSRRQAC